MVSLILIILIISTIGEILPIPFIEINQLFFILFFPIMLYFKRKSFKYLKINIILFIIITLSVYMLFQGLILSVDFDSYLRFMKNYIIAFSFIILTLTLTPKEHYKILNLYTHIASIIFVLEYILWKVRLFSIYLFIFNFPFSGIRNQAAFLSPNSYGIIISFLILSNLFLGIFKSKKYHCILALILIFPLFTTASRSAIFILLIGISIFGFLNSKLFGKVVIILSVLLIGYLLLSDNAFYILNDYNHIFFVRRFLNYFDERSLFGERTYEYIKIFEIYRDSWFTGLGFGNITGNNVLYVGMSSVHNEYLRFLIEGGVVGGFLFGFLIFILCFETYKLMRNTKLSKYFKNIIFTFFFMFLIAEMQYNFFNAHREGLILIFLGFSPMIYSKVLLLNVSIKKKIENRGIR
ncbi:MAG: O-antigen ligase family protein [Acholeplasma sp.]|nr:O-antigen ligase family protein [Acholeplasma sp.]